MARSRPRGSAGRRGMALVMVMVVLAALLVVATPFAISMMFHEKTTRTVVDQEHAQYAAEAARNHAVATLAWGHASAEADKNAVAPFNTPDADSLAETTVMLDDPDLTKRLEVASPRGRLLGLTVQDEQGKVNLRTASPELVARVQKYLGGRFANPRDVFTTHSGRDAEWITPARVRIAATLKSADPKNPTPEGTALFIDDATWFGVGTRVRVTAGTQVAYAQVVDNGGNNLVLDVVLPDSFDGQHAVVEAMARHPVNLNTAPREVLLALFEGIYWSEDDPKVEPEKVTAKASEFLVDRVLEKTVDGWKGFLDILAAVREKDLISGKLVHTLLLNAINPNHRKLAGSGTVPFCFTSYDVYGVEAVGVRNNPAANQVARRAFYEVLEVAPAGPLAWSLASQKQLDVFLPYECGFALRAKTRANLALVGRRVTPFSNGVVSWPNPTFAGQDADDSTAADAGDIRLYAENDERIKAAQHFAQFHDGLDTKKNALSMDVKSTIGDVIPPLKVPSGTAVPMGGGVSYPVIPNGWSNPPGGVEMWVQADSLASVQYFFDVSAKEMENHLWVRYASGELGVGVRDGGLEECSAEVRAPVAFDRGTWYHVAASWLSTRHGQLGLMLDGRPVGAFGYYDRSNRRLDGVLNGAISPSDTTISCTGYFPDKGCVQIGLEIVEYDGSSGGLQNCVRGARGTTAAAHLAGVPVYPLGYSDPVEQIKPNFPPPLDLEWDRIPVVKGRNVQKFGPMTSAILNSPPGGPPSIQAADPIIPTFDPTDDLTADFPDRGYLLIVGPAAGPLPVHELVYYDQKIPNVGFKVGNQGRGADVLDITSDGQAFKNGARIQLFSIEMTDTGNYSKNNGVCLFQINDEWFVGRPFADKTARYMVGLRVQIGNAISAFIDFGNRALGLQFLGVGVPGRAIFETPATGPASHAAQDPVLPVFAVRYGISPRGDDGNPGPPGAYPNAQVRYDYGFVGKNDGVTLVATDQVTKELATVKNGRTVRMGGTPVNLVALDKVTAREYVADTNGAARLLKFPSGEMLSYAPGPVAICDSAPATSNGGRMAGRLDELKLWSGKAVSTVLSKDLAASETNLIVFELGDAAQTDWSQNGGVFSVADETIGYVGYKLLGETTTQLPSNPPVTVALRQMELEGVIRGFLGTNAAPHQTGDLTLKHFGLAAIALDKAVGETDADFPLRNVRQGVNSGAGSIPDANGFPPSGFFLVDREMVGYTQVSPDVLAVPKNVKDEGIYRGAYGTEPDRHGATIAVAMPYRYADRERELAWDDSMSHYTVSRRATGALWRRVTWTADIPDRKLGLKVLVRVDGAPGWDSAPTNKPGGLYVLVDEKGKNAIEAHGDQIEVRVVFPYDKDSFRFDDLRENAWKQTPALQSLRVEYEQPVTSRYYEAR